MVSSIQDAQNCRPRAPKNVIRTCDVILGFSDSHFVLFVLGIPFDFVEWINFA